MATNSRLLPSLSNAPEIAMWLHNKLGSSDDIWSDKSSIVLQLNSEVLRNIKNCFAELQLNVKLKLLLSFLHVTKRNLDEWKSELEDLFDLASEDNDQWVSVIGELMKSFPREGTINFDPTSSSFYDMVNDLKKLVKKQDHKILPLEALYLNKKAFSTNFGDIPQPVKHFHLKRRAKSAALRAELLQKAADLSSGSKRTISGPAVPIRCRGLNNDSMPLKGIPSRNQYLSSSFSSSFGKSSLPSRLSVTASGSNRLARLASLTSGPSSSGSAGMKRDGGIVLLEINEAPSAALNQRDNKKQRRQQQPSASSKTGSDQQQLNIDENKEQTTPTQTPTDSEKPSTPSFSTIPAVGETNQNTLLGNKSSNQSDEESQQQPQQLTQKQPTSLFSTIENHNNRISMLQQQQLEQARTVIASKSTPDYAAGLLGSANTNNNQEQPNKLGALGNNFHSLLQKPQMPQQSSGQASMYQHPPQHQQSTSLIRTPSSKAMAETTTAMSYQQQQSSTSANIFNNNTINSSSSPTGSQTPTNLMSPSNQSYQQQQQKNTNLYNQSSLSPATSFQQSSANRSNLQSNMYQMQQMPFQQQQQQQPQRFQSQQPLFMQQQQQQNQEQQSQQYVNYGSNRFPTNQPVRSVIQSPNVQQQQPPPRPQQPVAYSPSTGQPYSHNEQSPPVAPRDSVRMASPQQLQEMQQQRMAIEALLREINQKFPNIPPPEKQTIINFFNGGTNPNPELGSEKDIRLGDTMELRNLGTPPQPARVLVETHLVLDYERRLCRKKEYFKAPAATTTEVYSNNPNFNRTPPTRGQFVVINSNQTGGQPRMVMLQNPQSGINNSALHNIHQQTQQQQLLHHHPSSHHLGSASMMSQSNHQQHLQTSSSDHHQQQPTSQQQQPQPYSQMQQRV